MTLPPVIRVFFAIDLPETVKTELSQFVGALKHRSKSHSIRWTKPENMHITLQFLAEVKTEHLSTLVENVRIQLQEAVAKESITFGGIHLFPSPYRPRVVVLNVLPQKALANLSTLIGRGIQTTHYNIDSRPFRAHLTLGRIKQPQGLNLSFLSEIHTPVIDTMDICDVALFRSEPHPDGSRYSVLERIRLGAH